MYPDPLDERAFRDQLVRLAEERTTLFVFALKAYLNVT
jgi:hypothetical protein